MTISRFRKTIRQYYRVHPRLMPWRRTRDPYRILISEIMLQQTQVSRVTTFYKKFIKQFPDMRSLARAKTADVLCVWQGLGYNRRALALQKLAKEVVEKYDGKLPRDRETLESLPGIGPYTAGAIRAFAFNEPEIFIETNIRRVFIHFFFPPGKAGENSQKKVTDVAIRRYIERTLDKKSPREWYYALMDYGAMLGEAARKGARGSKTAQNPNRRSAHYVRQSKFAGSGREIRGKILREILAKKKMKVVNLSKKEQKIIAQLAAEGFLVKNGRNVRII